MKNKLTVFEQIANTNKQYNASSKKERIVMLAQDVIELLKAKKIVTRTRGPFCTIPAITFDNVAEFDSSLKKVLPQVQCEVCGLGSMFVALVARKNRVATHIGEYGIQSMDRDLKTVLGKNLFHQVEIAYEMGEGWFNVIDNVLDESFFKAAVKFGKRYKSDDNRLIGIMKNIIKNEGEFKP